MNAAVHSASSTAAGLTLGTGFGTTTTGGSTGLTLGAAKPTGLALGMSGNQTPQYGFAISTISATDKPQILIYCARTFQEFRQQPQGPLDSAFQRQPPQLQDSHSEGRTRPQLDSLWEAMLWGHQVSGDRDFLLMPQERFRQFCDV